MVRIEELFTEEEIKERNRTKKWQETISKAKEIQRKFIDITENFFGGGFFWGSRVSIEDSHNPDYNATLINILPLHKGRHSLCIRLGPIYNQQENNRVGVYSPEYLDDALKLAKAYEEAGFGEFTIKKQYEE